MTKKKRLRWRSPLPLWLLAVAAAGIAMAWLAQYSWFPDGISLVDAKAPTHIVSEIEPVTSVMISEVMTANRRAWAGDNGQYADWVELYNGGSAPVAITGWTLTDKPTRRVQFTFPEAVLAPGEALLVYCSGELKNAAGAAYHAPFKLSSTGDAVLLYDASGTIMASLNVPQLAGNQAYARANSTGAWSITGQYTPGLPNTEANHLALTQHSTPSDSPIVLNELMAENVDLQREGRYDDWIELFNAGSEPVDLAGYSLSDAADNPQRWRLPAVMIAPGEYLVVYASGRDAVEGGALHANFKLNGEGETVLLTDAQGNRIAALSYELLKAGQVVARSADGTYRVSTSPTPGRANS